MTMLFKPRTVERIWDTWLYFHEGRHYLYWLHKTKADNNWDGMGVAVSDDGVHFREHGPIIHKADDAVWLGTGMVWRAGDTFMLNFSEERNGLQEIFFAESDDLLHWRRLPDEEHVCRADPAWYADAPTFSSQRWDCIWVVPREDGEGYVGYLTAVAKDGPPGLCGTAGFVVSDDGRHFRAGPPAVEPGVWGDRVEVGAVEKIGDRWYMLLGTIGMPLGARHIARMPVGETGMFPLVSDKQEGPFRLDPAQPLLLGSSPNWYTYFARFYRCGDELLLNHHTVPRAGTAEDSYFSPLKAVHQDAAGLLELRWWPGNEALKGASRPPLIEGHDLHGVSDEDVVADAETVRFAAASGGLVVLPARHDPTAGLILEAELELEETTGPLAGVGVFIEDRDTPPSNHPTVSGSLLLAQTDGRLSVGPYNGYAFRPEDAKPVTTEAGRPRRWRVLLRDEHVEVYVDDELVQCYTLGHTPSGRVGFVVEAGRARVSDVRLWRMAL